jgi:drug/metabolite transporter (DMT)-like permease
VSILFATLWGVLFHPEWPDVWTVCGALVIVAAGLYVWSNESGGRRVHGARKRGFSGKDGKA